MSNNRFFVLATIIPIRTGEGGIWVRWQKDNNPERLKAFCQAAEPGTEFQWPADIKNFCLKDPNGLVTPGMLGRLLALTTDSNQLAWGVGITSVEIQS